MPVATTSIRPCRPGDFEALYRLDQHCFDRRTAYRRSTLRAFLDLPGANCIVAVAGENVAGFILAAVESGQGRIITLDVHEQWRRKSFGSQLLTAAEQELAARGVESILLETATDNLPAIAFWQKHGYRFHGLAQGYYGRGRDAHLMHKLLTKPAESQKA